MPDHLKACKRLHNHASNSWPALWLLDNKASMPIYTRWRGWILWSHEPDPVTFTQSTRQLQSQGRYIYPQLYRKKAHAFLVRRRKDHVWGAKAKVKKQYSKITAFSFTTSHSSFMVEAWLPCISNPLIKIVAKE